MMNKLFLNLGIFLILGCDGNTYSSIDPIGYNPEISIKNDNGDIYVEIYDYPEIAGFQFDLDDGEGTQIISLEASGGLSEENNFTVSSGLLMCGCRARRRHSSLAHTLPSLW